MPLLHRIKGSRCNHKRTNRRTKQIYPKGELAAQPQYETIRFRLPLPNMAYPSMFKKKIYPPMFPKKIYPPVFPKRKAERKGIK